MPLPTAPYESGRYLGSVTRVEPALVHLNLPHGGADTASSYSGHRIARGEVGEFVLIEGETHAVLGRISQVRLPESERLTVEPSRDAKNAPTNPVGFVQLLVSFDISSGEIIRGVPEPPRIGQYAYAAHPDLIKHAIEGPTRDKERRIKLAHVPHSPTTLVTFAPSALFGRHCAILGATGGGKSWTIARLLGEVSRNRGKAILFDPSGEFHTLNERVRHVHLGSSPEGGRESSRKVNLFAPGSDFYAQKEQADRVHSGGSTAGTPGSAELVSFPYRHLSESDLFAMFQPGGGAQAPKLREALTSLKLAHCEPSLQRRGVLIKANTSKAEYEKALVEHAATIREPGADYDIAMLPEQIDEECVFHTARGGGSNSWGDYDPQSRGDCVTLIGRISVQLSSRELSSIFAPGGAHDLTEVLDEFLDDDDTSILRISMEDLPFEHNTRELVANGIGRYLLSKGRDGRFRQQPLLTILDEAHQFLNKSVGDELNRVQLEAFGLIAKEGRKYGLLTVLSTQRPRDIPEDVLSQMGMFIVHRLINEKDRHIVERASGSLDLSATDFLPVLGQGEALIIGLGTPMAMPVQILLPDDPPDSTDIALW